LTCFVPESGCEIAQELVEVHTMLEKRGKQWQKNEWQKVSRYTNERISCQLSSVSMRHLASKSLNVNDWVKPEVFSLGCFVLMNW